MLRNDLAVTEKAGDLIWLALADLDSFREMGEDRVWDAPLEPRGAEQLAKVWRVRELRATFLDKEWRLDHQLVCLRLKRIVMEVSTWRAQRTSRTRKRSMQTRNGLQCPLKSRIRG